MPSHHNALPCPADNDLWGAVPLVHLARAALGDSSHHHHHQGGATAWNASGLVPSEAAAAAAAAAATWNASAAEAAGDTAAAVPCDAASSCSGSSGGAMRQSEGENCMVHKVVCAAYFLPSKYQRNGRSHRHAVGGRDVSMPSLAPYPSPLPSRSPGILAAR